MSRGVTIVLVACTALLASLNLFVLSKSATGLADVVSSVSLSDLIQALNVVAVTMTLIVVAWQVSISNKLAKAQIVKDRFEMYWKVAHGATSQAEIDALRSSPERSYMDAKLFEEYYTHEDGRIRDYIDYSKIYEYMAFLHTLNSIGIKDPLGKEWFPNWVRDLVENREFLEINQQYHEYYPKFANYVDTIVAAKTSKKLETE